MSISDDDLTNLLNEELFARRVKALFLSNAGATIAKIAEELGVSTGTVRKDLEIAKRQYLSETPDQRRAIQMSIILDARRANYAAMIRGDRDAWKTILEGLAQEGRLFGLYPKVLEVPGIDAVAAANEAAALIQRIAQIDPAGLKEITRGAEPPPLDVDEVPARADRPVGDQGASGTSPFDAARPGEPGAPDTGSGGRDPGAEGVRGGSGAGPRPAGNVAELPRPADDADDDDDDWSNIGD